MPGMSAASSGCAGIRIALLVNQLAGGIASLRDAPAVASSARFRQNDLKFFSYLREDDFAVG